MVQEFQVLRCFSCEAFQAHIVKKTNKWECKVCGVKQSMKKVYGQGSGKDCRLHTQKLNALRGEKRENVAVLEDITETNEVYSISSDQFQINSQSSLTCAGVKFDTEKTCKWAEYLEDHEQVNTSNCSPEERIVDHDFGDKIGLHSAPKRKFLALENNVEDAVSENVDNRCFINKHPKLNISRYVKQNTAKFNNCVKSASAKNPLKNEEKIISSNLKTINPTKQSIQKTSLKWGKYLSDEPTGKSLCSKNKTTVPLNLLNSKENKNISNLFENDQSTNNIRKINISNPNKIQENSFDVDLHDYLENGENTLPSFKKEQVHPVQKFPAVVEHRLVHSESVFEQLSELSDSDFQLDF